MIPSGVFTFWVHAEPGPGSRIELPYLAGGSYVDVEAAQDVELVINARQTHLANVLLRAPGQLSHCARTTAVSETGL